MNILTNLMNYFAENGSYMLGTIGMILVLSLMLVVLLKLNYKDLWVVDRERQNANTKNNTSFSFH